MYVTFYVPNISVQTTAEVTAEMLGKPMFYSKSCKLEKSRCLSKLAATHTWGDPNNLSVLHQFRTRAGTRLDFLRHPVWPVFHFFYRKCHKINFVGIKEKRDMLATNILTKFDLSTLL